jgi:hypothetical protein
MKQELFQNFGITPVLFLKKVSYQKSHDTQHKKAQSPADIIKLLVSNGRINVHLVRKIPEDLIGIFELLLAKLVVGFG